MSSEYETDSSDDSVDEIDFESSRVDEEKPHVRVLTFEQAVQEHEKIINEVQSATTLSTAVVRALLRLHGYCCDEATSKYYEDPEAMLTKIGVDSTTTQDDAVTECGICWGTFKPHELTRISQCQHAFCNECWSGYLTVQILDNGKCAAIQCMQSACKALVDDDIVRELLREQRARDIFERALLRSYVECNPLLQFCSKPECEQLVAVRRTETEFVQCACGQQFCFKCGAEWHKPLDCSLLARWLKRNSDDTETGTYFVARTKHCPSCQVLIEKNGGCNEMLCKKCNATFCWHCGKGLKSETNADGHTRCSIFRETITEEVATAEMALDRYHHYYRRYINHWRSLRSEEQLRELVKLNINKVKTQKFVGLCCSATNTLYSAADILCHSRRVLMFTYPFAFYVKPHVQVEIFEENQINLERATESLSSNLEKHIDQDNVEDIVTEVKRLKEFCSKRSQTLIDFVSEGNKKGWWSWRDI